MSTRQTPFTRLASVQKGQSGNVTGANHCVRPESACRQDDVMRDVVAGDAAADLGELHVDAVTARKGVAA